MSTSAGTAYVDMRPDFSGFYGPLEKALAPITSKFGAVGKAAVVGLAGIGVAAAGAGVALFKIGDAFDDAYDAIRVGTGKSGKALEGLKDSFREVVRTVPTDFGKASKAITEVNQRLGLTGKPLEAMAEQMLELSRITGTDLSTNIKSVSRLFGDWSIATGDQAGKLDELFRASQKTGVPIEQLAQTMTKFGGPLRQLGFSFDEAAAMAAKFEKEGVNTELVMGSLRIALGRMAKDGEKPVKTLQRVVEQIKNAGDSGKANALALELFGARAGPDMAAAIREGRFEIDNLVGAIKGGKETIRGAGQDTQDFGEKWQLFKNRVLLVLEPIATRVFDGIGKAMEWISNISLSKVIAWFRNLGDTISNFLAPVVAVFKDAWEKFGDLVIDVAQNIYETVSGVIGGVITTLKGIIDFLKGVFTGDWGRIWDGIKSIFRGAWESMKSIVTGIVDGIVNLVKIAFRSLATALGAIWDGIKAAASAAWNAIRNLVHDAVDAVVGFVKGIAGRVADFAASIWSGLKTAFTSAWTFLKDTVRDGVSAVVDFIRSIPERIATFASGLFKGIGEAFNDVVKWIRDRIGDIIEFVRSIPGKIAAIAGAIFKPIRDAFDSTVGWLIDRWKDFMSVINDGDANIQKLIDDTNAAIRALNAAKDIASTLSPLLNTKTAMPSTDVQGFRVAGTSVSAAELRLRSDPAINNFRFFLGEKEIDVRVEKALDGHNWHLGGMLSAGVLP